MTTEKEPTEKKDTALTARGQVQRFDALALELKLSFDQPLPSALALACRLMAIDFCLLL